MANEETFESRKKAGNRSDGKINRFSIDNFTAKFLKVGLITPSNFFVSFTPPSTVPNQDKFKDVGLFCAATSLPGRRIATSEQRPYGYGQVIKMPYDVIQDDIELTFYVDAENATSLDFFTQWMNSIIDPAEGFPQNNASRMKVKYKKGNNGYTTDIRIYVVSQLEGSQNPGDITTTGGALSASSEEGYAIIECKLVEAYPIQITPIALDWGDGDQFMRVNVTFAFRTAVYAFGEAKAVEGGKTYRWTPGATYVGQNQFSSQLQTAADLLTSTASFIGNVRRTSQKIQQFKTNWRNLGNSTGASGTINALVPIFGFSPQLRQVNQIVNDVRFIKSVFKNP